MKKVHVFYGVTMRTSNACEGEKNCNEREREMGVVKVKTLSTCIKVRLDTQSTAPSFFLPLTHAQARGVGGGGRGCPGVEKKIARENAIKNQLL